MLFLEKRIRGIAGGSAFGIAVLGGATAGVLAAATHPLAASAALGAFASAVSCATSAACVSGTNSTSGPGVAGTSAKGSGVQGKSTSSYGVYGSSSTGLAGIYGTNATSSGAGVYGASTSGVGVFGQSANDIGVYGIATNSTSKITEGVVGVAVDGDGLYGGATGTGTAVAGSSASGYAGHFTSTNNYGVFAESQNNVAFVGRTYNGNASDIQGSHVGLLGRAPTSGFPLVLTDANANTVFQVDGYGNVAYAGGLSSFASTVGGGKARSFSASGTRPTIEDSGTAQLVNGAAIVRLDPTFAASIDATTAYRVFLTPAGDTRGLYVANRSLAGFVVRESQAGRSTVAFDYRILATALGKASQHMTPIAPATDASVVKAPLPVIPATAASAPVKLPALPKE